jgi:hypothetical protein
VSEDVEPEVDQARITRNHDFKWIAIVLFWMTGYFWLRGETDFPDSFAVRLPHGQAGVFEEYWYSYLLLERHQPWDIALFVWLWGTAIAIFWYLRSRVTAKDAKSNNEEASDDIS